MFYVKRLRQLAGLILIFTDKYFVQIIMSSDNWRPEFYYYSERLEILLHVSMKAREMKVN